VRFGAILVTNISRNEFAFSLQPKSVRLVLNEKSVPKALTNRVLSPFILNLSMKYCNLPARGRKRTNLKQNIRNELVLRAQCQKEPVLLVCVERVISV